jgi:hypothetical protein
MMTSASRDRPAVFAGTGIAIAVLIGCRALPARQEPPSAGGWFGRACDSTKQCSKPAKCLRGSAPDAGGFCLIDCNPFPPPRDAGPVSAKCPEKMHCALLDDAPTAKRGVCFPPEIEQGDKRR